MENSAKHARVFFAGCGPCKMIAPTYAKLAEDNSDVEFVKVDVDNEDLEVRSAQPRMFHTRKCASLIDSHLLCFAGDCCCSRRFCYAKLHAVQGRQDRKYSSDAWRWRVDMMQCTHRAVAGAGQDRHWSQPGEDRGSGHCCQGLSNS